MIMFKKYVIPGLVLFVTGAAVLGWLLAQERKEQQKASSYKLKHGSEPGEHLKQYTESLQLALDRYGKTKTEAQLKQEQQERLKADLNKLAAGNKDTYPFADILYGENWQKELSKYKRRKELRELIFTGSIVCTFTGGAIFTWCLLLWTGRPLIKTSSHLIKSVADIFRSRSRGRDEELLQKELLQANAQAKIKPKAQAEEKVGVESDATENGIPFGQREKRQGQQGQVTKLSHVLRNSGWQSFEANSAGRGEQTLPQTPCSMKSGPGVENSAKNAEEIAVLLSDEKSTEDVESLKTAAESVNVSTKLEDSLKAQTENLEKQMAEFKQMAQGVQQAALEQSKPLNGTLSELTQQVSAIREYAASQQDRMKKLQDGYDWNIMRTFCLRVIRCIDNLESRISRLTEQDIEVADLEEVRDELVFALESSGVEQFEPEINSDYHGQEKYAEAVKEKECCDDSNRKGKIANVIRPGYQYFIDDENFKVVRPAQVKLFG